MATSFKTINLFIFQRTKTAKLAADLADKIKDSTN